MIWETRSSPSLETRSKKNALGVKALLALAVATSIDALAVGLTLPMLNAPLGVSIATIAVTTALPSTAGLFAGRYFGTTLGRRLDAAGGLVLIGLGFKILLGHLRAT
jgi:putative Mn2+ efflux pump MntP